MKVLLLQRGGGLWATAVSLELFARTDVDFLEFFAGADLKARLEVGPCK